MRAGAGGCQVVQVLGSGAGATQLSNLIFGMRRTQRRGAPAHLGLLVVTLLGVTQVTPQCHLEIGIPFPRLAFRRIIASHEYETAVGMLHASLCALVGDKQSGMHCMLWVCASCQWRPRLLPLLRHVLIKKRLLHAWHAAQQQLMALNRLPLPTPSMPACGPAHGTSCIAAPMPTRWQVLAPSGTERIAAALTVR